MDEIDAILSIALGDGVPKKKKKSSRKKDDDSDTEMPPVDPMLQPFGNDAEEEMRKKLKKRMKKLKKEKKEKKKKRKSGSDTEQPGSSGLKSTVKTIQPPAALKSAVSYYPPPEPYPSKWNDYGHEEDGYRSRHRSHHREPLPQAPHIASSVNVIKGPPPSIKDVRWVNDRYEDTTWEAPNYSSPPRSRSPPRYDRSYRSSSRYSHRGPPSPVRSTYTDVGDYRSRDFSSPPPSREYRSRPSPPRPTSYNKVAPPAGRASSRGGPRGRGKQYTGFGFHRKSRSRSPEEDRGRSSMSSRPSPPRQMPEHIRWLHDRWRKYDKNFFKQGSDLKPAEFGKSGGKTAGTGANTEPLASKRKFNEDRESDKEKPLALTGSAAQNPHLRKFAMPYYQFRKGGEYHWNPGRMLSFKEFLLQQPEDIEDQDEAVKQYTEYKLTFRQKALAEFFQAHSEDEWFLEKYHPILKSAIEQKRQLKIQKRLDVFMQLLVRGWMEVTLEMAQSKKVRKLMDAAIVLMEGGDEGDIACLNDLDYILEEKKEESYEAEKKEEEEEESDDEEEDPKNIGKAPGGGRTHLEQQQDEEYAKMVGGAEKTDEQLELMQHARDYTLYLEEHMKDKKEAEMEAAPDNVGEPETTIETTKEFTGSGVFISQTVAPKPLEEMNLHKVSAVILKNVPTSVPRVEIEELCGSAHGGFLRCYLSEPEADNQYCRTAIVSFWYNANLQKILWKIRGTKLRGESVVVLEFREFKRRIDAIDGLSGDKSVVLRDIQLCKSLIEYLDRRFQLWGDAPSAAGVCFTPPPSDKLILSMPDLKS